MQTQKGKAFGTLIYCSFFDIMNTQRETNMEDNKLIEKFIEHSYSTNSKSKHTKKSYKHTLDTYQMFLIAECSSVLSANQTVAENFNAMLSDSDLSNATIRHELAVLRSFYTYLIDCELTHINPFKTIKGPRLLKLYPKYSQMVKAKLPEFCV